MSAPALAAGATKQMVLLSENYKIILSIKMEALSLLIWLGEGFTFY